MGILTLLRGTQVHVQREGAAVRLTSTIRVVIAGGGTGGHVQPALAVLRELRRKTHVDVLWIGSKSGLERAVAAEHGVAFTAIQTGKLRRYFSLQTPIDAARIPIGLLQAIQSLKRFRPDVVYSTGGFVSVPAVVASRLLGISSITHEQTATVGLATRINARFANVVALSFEQSRAQLPKTRASVVVTGNPVRQELFTSSADRARATYHLPDDVSLVYVTGGALGAHAINEVVRQALPRLLEIAAVIHQCGPASANGDLPLLESARNQLSPALREHYVIRERLGSELADVYAAAALVVGRAGAGTVSELAALGKASILIPLPGAGGDEQTRNAKILSDAGGTILLPEAELNPERLLREIADALVPNRREAMERAARSRGSRDAAGKLAHELVKLAGGTDQP